MSAPVKAAGKIVPQRRSPGAVAGCASFLLALASVTGCGHAAGSPTTPAGPPLSTPLATSLATASGTWAAVPMGHLDQPLNTFWQLLFLPTRGAHWSDLVAGTAVATNGGLLLASTGGRSLLVGVRPANLLAFSPLVSTSDDGRTWSPGLLASGLTAHPDALAVDPSGRSAALIAGPGGTVVQTSNQGLSGWHTLITQQELASSSAARTCGPLSLTAVGYAAGRLALGAACARPGVLGLFTEESGGLRLIGPTMPATLRRATLEVLGLYRTGGQLTVLLAAATNSGTSLVAAWSTSGPRWDTTAVLPLARGERLASFGPAGASGYFVLLARPSGNARLEVADAAGVNWHRLPDPPPDTVTAAFSSGRVDALAVVGGGTLVDYRLTTPIARWLPVQMMNVPIPYGSSS